MKEEEEVQCMHKNKKIREMQIAKELKNCERYNFHFIFEVLEIDPGSCTCQARAALQPNSVQLLNIMSHLYGK